MYDQKNIRRRVYDALNVLMAMNIISKEKKEIKWIGLPTNSAQECQNLEVRPPPFFFFCGTLLFPKLRFSTATLPTGGATKTAGEDQTETITASGAHPAGERRRPGLQRRRRRELTVAPLHFNRRSSFFFFFFLQQIAFKNLVQRNRQTEQQANRPPPPNSIIHLPFIIVNTSKKTVIDCSISSDKYDSFTLLTELQHVPAFKIPPVEVQQRWV